MKIIATIGAGVLAVTGVAATAPADAQRGGWNDGPRDGRGWDRNRRWDRGQDRRWRDDRGWRGDRRGWRDWNRGWRGDRGWNRGWRGNRGWYGQPRTTCRWVDGYYGPVRRCFRIR